MRSARFRAGRVLLTLLPLLAFALALGPSRVVAQVMDRAIYVYVAADELEYAPGAGEEPVVLDAMAWIGGDYNRLWLRAEAERSTLESEGEYEAQALYGRFVAPYWDAQVGVRLDVREEPGEADARAHLAVGMEGLAPYWFEVESALFVSQAGDVSARLEAGYELLFTQRLILEPELEANLALQEVPEWGVGSGLSDVELGARLRYEIRRELAPYAGIEWHRRVGESADLARAAGGDVGEASLVFGLRAWW